MKLFKNVFKHKGHIAYQITEKLVIIKHLDKIKFWFPKRGIVNIKFHIYPHAEWKYWHWLIWLPFLCFEKDNGGYKIGFPNLYLWIIK